MAFGTSIIISNTCLEKTSMFLQTRDSTFLPTLETLDRHRFWSMTEILQDWKTDSRIAIENKYGHCKAVTFVFCVSDHYLCDFLNLISSSRTLSLTSNTAENTQSWFGKPQSQLSEVRIDKDLSKNFALHFTVLGLSVKTDA